MRAGRDEDTWRSQEVAKFLNRSLSWIRNATVEGAFRYPDGTVIEAARKGNQRFWTLDQIAAMAESCWRIDRFSDEERDLVLRRVEAFRAPPKRKTIPRE